MCPKKSKPEFYEKFVKFQEKLFGQLADFDEKFAEEILKIDHFSKLDPQLALDASRRATLGAKIVPVTLGSSLKNFGIEKLLDHVTQFLPSPADLKPDFLRFYSDSGFENHLVAYAFKV